MNLDPLRGAIARDASMPRETVLANALLVLPERVALGRLTLADGLIVAVDEGGAVPPGAVDCGGDMVMPGLVELHTDNLERHIEPRPGVDWPHAQAIVAHDAELAGCGITTVFDALRIGVMRSGGIEEGRIYARSLATEIAGLRAAGALRIDHRLHLRAEICSETLPEELGQFGPDDGVGLLSLMDHTPGQRQFRDLGKLRDYASRRPGFTEAGFLVQMEEQKAFRAALGDRHEALAVVAAQRMGAAIASHDDTDEAQVAVSAAHGAVLAEFPTTIEAARACRDAGIAVMMGAPNLIRGGSHSGNVSAAGLARAGLLDVVSSDYVPSALLASAFRLAALWDGDLARAVATVTAAPARAAGLTDRGRLDPGLRADVIRVARVLGHPVTRGAWSAGLRVA